MSGASAADRAATLVEALPYIRRFADQVVVVKYGGNALAGASDDDALALFAQDIVLMRQVGMRPVVVHGGGPQISDLMGRLGKQSEFRNGLRVTDGETIDIVRMVLIGQVNPQLVAAINVHGPLAVGVSGEDAGLIRAAARHVDLGFVGDVESINPTILNALLDDEFIPVVATIGTDVDGQAYNINADTVAGAIAEALGAEKLVYLTDIEGLRRTIDDPASLIRQTTPDELDALMAEGRELCACRAQRRSSRAHSRWSDRTRVATGNIHRRGDRDDGPMSTHAFDTSAAPIVCPFMPVFGAPQVMFVRGSGTELWDSNGKRYLDFLGGLAVIALGHSHPLITEVISEQAGTLMHVSNLFATDKVAEAAIKLNALLAETTGAVGQVFFCNSGAEANETALKLARKFGGRGRHGVVSAFGSFHGRTLAALAATGQPAKHEPFFPMPDGFRHVAYNDIAALEAAIDTTVSAVLLEPVQGEGGVVPADDQYLRDVRALCDERGLLLMLDEIQTGFGRTGEWFGFQHSGVVPDVVTMAKAMGNGFPVGATWAKREVSAVFQPGDHGSTYSGTALATAVVSAVIDEMRRIDAPGLAAKRGEYFTARLRELPGIADVRGRGLLLAAELTDGTDAKVVYNELLEHGLVTNAVTPTSLRFAPPLTVTEGELDEAIAIIAAVLQ